MFGTRKKCTLLFHSSHQLKANKHLFLMRKIENKSVGMVLKVDSVSERRSQRPSSRHLLIKHSDGPSFPHRGASSGALSVPSRSPATSRRSRAFARCCRMSLHPCSPSGPLPSAVSSPRRRSEEAEEPWRVRAAPPGPGEAYPA